MKKIITIITTISILLSTIVVIAKDYTDYPQKFHDVPKDHWAFEYISELHDKNVISGYEDGSFKPNKTVSRAEWSRIMVGAAGIISNDTTIYFTDTKDHWGLVYINASKDYMTSYSNNTFRPDQSALREDVTVAMVKLKGYDVSEADYSYLSAFTDQNSISNDCKKYVSVAVEKGLISGFDDNTFRGQDTLTRAEASTLLWKAFQYGNDDKIVETNITTTPEPTSTPISTPIPTNTPEPTPTVTPIPTTSPENTLETSNNDDNDTNSQDEEIVSEKEWKVETLAKADVSGVSNGGDLGIRYHMIQHDDDMYYYDKITKAFYKINMITRENEVVAYAKDIIIEYDDEEWKLQTIKDLFYDNSNDRLMIHGEFKSMEVIPKHSDLNAHGFISIPDCEKINIKMYHVFDDDILGITENTNMLICNAHVNISCRTLAGKYEYNTGAFISATDKQIISFVETDNCLYFIAGQPSGGSIYKYDYNKFTKIKDVGRFGGVNKNGFYTINDGTFAKLNFDGKTQYSFTTDDIQIKDKLPISSLSYLLLISSNDDIVFYDLNTKAFRIISKNE